MKSSPRVSKVQDPIRSNVSCLNCMFSLFFGDSTQRLLAKSRSHWIKCHGKINSPAPPPHLSFPLSSTFPCLSPPPCRCLLSLSHTNTSLLSCLIPWHYTSCWQAVSEMARLKSSWHLQASILLEDFQYFLLWWKTYTFQGLFFGWLLLANWLSTQPQGKEAVVLTSREGDA